jgi:hypothetical protein
MRVDTVGYSGRKLTESLGNVTAIVSFNNHPVYGMTNVKNKLTGKGFESLCTPM